MLPSGTLEEEVNRDSIFVKLKCIQNKEVSEYFEELLLTATLLSWGSSPHSQENLPFNFCVGM